MGIIPGSAPSGSMTPGDIWNAVLAAAGRQVDPTNANLPLDTAASQAGSGTVSGQLPNAASQAGMPPATGLTGSYVPNGTTPNAGQVDAYGNVYYPIDNSAWNGQYLDPTKFPKVSTTNQQLWGGPNTDSPPQWFQTMVAQAVAMPDGPAKTARIAHIMSSLATMGANMYDVAYADQQFGLTPKPSGGV